jgi:hypothetical protein
MNTDDDKKSVDERLARDAQRLLRRSAEDLDAATLARLKRARENALAGYEAGKRVSFRFGAGWQPALGAAAVCASALIAVGLWMGRAPAPSSPGPVPPVSAEADPAADLEVVLADDENLEMIEDLEFYDWLESDHAPQEPSDPGLSG